MKTILGVVSAVGQYNNMSNYLIETDKKSKKILLIVTFKNGIVAEKILFSKKIKIWDEIIFYEPEPNTTSGLNPIGMNRNFKKFEDTISELSEQNIDGIFSGVIPKLPSYNFMPRIFLKYFPQAKLNLIEDGTATYMLQDNDMFESMVLPTIGVMNMVYKKIKKKINRKENGIFFILIFFKLFLGINFNKLLKLDYSFKKKFHFDKLIISDVDKFKKTKYFSFKEIEFFDFEEKSEKSISLLKYNTSLPLFIDQNFGINIDRHVENIAKIMKKDGYDECYIKMHPKSRTTYINSFRFYSEFKFNVISEGFDAREIIGKDKFDNIYGFNSTALFYKYDNVNLKFIMQEYINYLTNMEIFMNYNRIDFMKKSSENLSKISSGEIKKLNSLKYRKIIGEGVFILSGCKELFFSKNKTFAEKLEIQSQNYLKKNPLPVEQDLFFFESYRGMYAGSPRAIFEEMLKNPKYKDKKYFWAISHEIDVYSLLQLKKIKNVELGFYGKSKYLDYISRSKIVVVNMRLHRSFIKKEGQCVIQTWHGTPFKKDALSVNLSSHNVSHETRIAVNNHDVKNYDYLLFQNMFSEKELGNTFDMHSFPNIIPLQLGYPRNDKLFNCNNEDIANIKEKYDIPLNKKIILYAPTWRDHHKTNTETINEIFDFDLWENKIGKEYFVLFRGHYFHSAILDLKKYSDFMLDVTEYNDINDFYLISDILITDYSSVYFDYSNLNRQVLFYMPDYFVYTNLSRKLHFDIHTELPGPVAFEFSELESNIENIDQISKNYQKKRKLFREKFNLHDDGNCAHKVIQRLEIDGVL